MSVSATVSESVVSVTSSSSRVSASIASTTIAAVVGPAETLTVPGPPLFASSLFLAGNTEIQFFPGDNGQGSAVVSNDFYVDGVLSVPDVENFTSAGKWFFVFQNTDLSGSVVELQHTNVVGQGPKSDPVTIP